MSESERDRNGPRGIPPTMAMPASETPAPQPFAPQPFAPQPFAPQPFAPQPFAPQPFAPQPFAPQPSAPDAPTAHPAPPYAPAAQASSAHGGAHSAEPSVAPPIRPDRGQQRSGGGGAIVAAIVGVGCLGVVGLGVIGAGAAVFWLRAATAAPIVVGADAPAIPPVAAPPLAGGPTVAHAAGLDPYEAERLRVVIPPGSPTRGAADARVTIVESADFQCPYCARVEPTLDRLLAEHQGDVRVVWLDHPLDSHPAARFAARAAIEAQAQGGDARFWAMHDALFENQRTLDREQVFTIGVQLGLEPTRLGRAIDTPMHDPSIDGDVALATQLGERGTPTFFVDGRPLRGAQPYETFERMVREEIEHAMRLEASGVPRARLYDAMIEHARLAPGPEAAARAVGVDPLEDPTRLFRVPVGTSPVHGAPDALVTIVVFSDFQCPFCARVAPTLARVQQTYGRDVRIAWRHLPLAFHQRAVPAAIAASEVYAQLGADGFYRMHDLLFENQRALEDDDLVRYAEQVGARGALVRSALGTQAHRAEIDADADLARQLGVSGTPQFFVNGRSLRGAQPYERFATLIEAELARARAMVASGTPRERVYDAILAGAQ